jgi:hypothetical protein
MKRILSSIEGLRICSSYGYNPDDFVSHSLRKGAGTFATSGSTIGVLLFLCTTEWDGSWEE